MECSECCVGICFIVFLSGFLDEEFAESVTVVSMVEGSAYRFSLCWKLFEFGVFHDILFRIFEAHALSMHLEGYDKSAISQEGVF